MDWLPWLVIALMVGAVVFIVLREFWCWYWKINSLDGTLKDIRTELRSLNAELRAGNAPEPAEPEKTAIA